MISSKLSLSYDFEMTSTNLFTVAVYKYPTFCHNTLRFEILQKLKFKCIKCNALIPLWEKHDIFKEDIWYVVLDMTATIHGIMRYFMILKLLRM